jgi:hypothetical protein
LMEVPNKLQKRGQSYGIKVRRNAIDVNGAAR